MLFLFFFFLLLAFFLWLIFGIFNNLFVCSVYLESFLKPNTCRLFTSYFLFYGWISLLLNLIIFVLTLYYQSILFVQSLDIDFG